MRPKIFLIFLLVLFWPWFGAEAAYHFSDYRGIPPIHIFRYSKQSPVGITPDKIKAIYNLPKAGGHGTIALIGAYDDPNIEKDLNVFSQAFNLPLCSAVNGCFEKHKISSSTSANSGWTLETSLDVEWAHAIAPKAKILLVEAKTPSGANLLKAVDYAASRSDVVAISMSWGGPEFAEEVSLDKHFASKSGVAFFASSGDNGAGVSWPASSPNVIGVGGTTINFSGTGKFLKETAWQGSGGGVSAYEVQPDYQKSYNIPKASGMRAIPDVAYDADPSSGFPVYKIGGVTSHTGWFTLGGTSAGAPQWAAIQSLRRSVSLAKLYNDKAAANNGKFFRDITSGFNGACHYYCNARKKYDYVTGLGSPQTSMF